MDNPTVRRSARFLPVQPSEAFDRARTHGLLVSLRLSVSPKFGMAGHELGVKSRRRHFADLHGAPPHVRGVPSPSEDDWCR